MFSYWRELKSFRRLASFEKPHSFRTTGLSFKNQLSIFAITKYNFTVIMFKHSDSNTNTKGGFTPAEIDFWLCENLIFEQPKKN